jgi:hypothetical protein
MHELIVLALACVLRGQDAVGRERAVCLQISALFVHRKLGLKGGERVVLASSDS